MCRCFCNCKILHARPCCVFIVCSLVVICVGVGFAVVNYWPEISGNSGKNGSWTCYRSSCRKCETLEVPSIRLNASLCTNITYLSEDDGFFYIVSVNESVIYNETLTDLNPPLVCVEEPSVEQYGKACIRLYDVIATQTNLQVCAAVEATKKLHFIKKYELGCFNIKPLKVTKKQAVLEENTEHAVIVT